MRKKRSGKAHGARLGQHFLTGQWAAVRLAACIRARQGETILEIGPGKGALTRELLKTGARVIAVEKDKALVVQLHETFKNEIASGQLELIEKDIRDVDLRSLKLEAQSYCLASNIPYYITGEIIRMFLTAEPHPRALALLVQKEVAQRIANSKQRTANRKNPKESVLSISVKAYGTPQIIASVSRGNFSPPPSVDSAILLITNISRDFFAGIDESSFFNIVRAGFSSKRKLLRRNLEKFGFTKPKFETCGIGEHARAEDVPLEEWKCLCEQLKAES